MELDSADQALRAASVLRDGALLRDAVSRLYYAVFHAARAALLVDGRHAKTHSGQLTLFTTTFGPAPTARSLLELRIEADDGVEPSRSTTRGCRP